MIDQKEPLRLFESPDAPAQLRRLLTRAQEDVPSFAEQEHLIGEASRRGTAGGSAAPRATSRLRWAARVARHAPKLVSAIAIVGAGAGMGVYYSGGAHHRQAPIASTLVPLGREAPLVVPMEAPNSPAEHERNDSLHVQSPARQRPARTSTSEATAASGGARTAGRRDERPGEGLAASHRSASSPAAGMGDSASGLAASAPSPKESAPSARREAAPSAAGRSVEGASAGEAALLLAARQALATSPARALSLAQEHLRRYPHGILDQEREALTIEALIALGQVDQASTRAKAFEHAYPASPHRARIEHALARAAGAAKEP